MARRFFVSALLQGYSLVAAQYLNWSTYEANGINLGGWLVQESTIDTTWWAEYSRGAPDEWGLCANQGTSCGAVLERRYATWITPAVIDDLFEAGVNTLRIPTTYAAWVKVPDMHIIIDLHSLPGGVNGMAFGEAEGHFGWFNNQTALRYSLEVVDAVIDYVQNSGHPESYTIAPINEPVDNTDLSFFGTPLALSMDGAAWVLQYILTVIARVSAVNMDIPIMFQGSFLGETYWSPFIPSDANVVFDVHHYYFAGRGATGQNITSYICSDAELSPGDGKFPVFIGEWSMQTEFDNRLAERERALNTGLYAFAAHTRGSSYWTAKFFGNNTVDGEGTQADYWNYLALAEQGMINPSKAQGECSGL
ncbi:glycoside hydrolase superfamily [Aspergillus undulatus]|uniref:glycoside hydrolase superfamily n=1 Tax=Aspergillus undulatus TaxID=1810928 RepID=UPI003CCD643C